MTTRQDIEDYINSLPEEQQEGARRYQWSIDQQLNKCKNETERYNTMVAIFWEGVVKFQKTLENPSSARPEQVPDNIVTFKKD